VPKGSSPAVTSVSVMTGVAVKTWFSSEPVVEDRQAANLGGVLHHRGRRAERRRRRMAFMVGVDRPARGCWRTSSVSPGVKVALVAVAMLSQFDGDGVEHLPLIGRGAQRLVARGHIGVGDDRRGGEDMVLLRAGGRDRQAANLGGVLHHRGRRAERRRRRMAFMVGVDRLHADAGAFQRLARRKVALVAVAMSSQLLVAVLSTCTDRPLCPKARRPAVTSVSVMTGVAVKTWFSSEPVVETVQAANLGVSPPPPWSAC